VDQQQIAMKLALDALAIPLRLESFDDRLILQKATYLAQAAGVRLGYWFQWYLRGPYCPSLTRDAFTLLSELASDPEAVREYSLDAESVKRLRELRGLLDRIPQAEQARKLELLASVHFLLESRTGTERSPAALQEVLKRYAKNFSVSEIEQAVQELTRHGLCEADSRR